jgi:hypothetical protein
MDFAKGFNQDDIEVLKEYRGKKSLFPNVSTVGVVG